MTREEVLKEREKEYVKISNDIYYFRDKLSCYKRISKSSLAFKQLDLALKGVLKEIETETSKYKEILDNKSLRKEMKQLQQALNREKAKNFKLEKDIEEAKTSSSLFIKYVKEKFKWDK